MRLIPAIAFLLLPAAIFAQDAGWALVWNDEFSGAAKTPPDATKWNNDLGGGGWGNNERETYTNSTDNVFQDGNGHLVIRALNSNGSYTSARLKTQDRFTFTYGKVVARIRIPYAQGIWPAFWMLGADITSVGWPACGEIDIMENFGKQNGDAGVNHGTVHGPGYSGGGGITNSYKLSGGKFADDFHTFSMEWGPDSIELFVDGNSYSKVTPASLPDKAKWVFNDSPFFLLLNVAVGGSPAPVGYPDATTTFPQDMLVDYVRVYQRRTGAAITPGGVVNAASFLGALAPGGLATLYGTNLSDVTFTAGDLYDSSAGAFTTKTSSGISVTVNGVAAPLTYVSSSQINFQAPWETPTTPAPVDVRVVNESNATAPEPLNFSAAAPSVFLDFNTATALVSSCSAITPGTVCVLWGNGFGPTQSAAQNGAPLRVASDVVGGSAACQLTIAGQRAQVLYCGAAPGLVIDQLNFVYPAGVAPGPPVDATLSIAGETGNFKIAAPAM